MKNSKKLQRKFVRALKQYKKHVKKKWLKAEEQRINKLLK